MPARGDTEARHRRVAPTRGRARARREGALRRRATAGWEMVRARGARLQRMQLGRGLSNRVPKRSLVMFYAPKFSLVLILWILLYASYMLLLTRRKGDPSYQIVDADEDGEFEDDGDA